MSYPGETWEQRWLASGFDAAPRSWMDQFDLPRLRRWIAGTARDEHAAASSGCCDRPTAGCSTRRAKVNLAKLLDINAGDALNGCASYPPTAAVLAAAVRR